MKLQRGFTLIELMVSMGIVVTVVAIATGSLMQAEHATTAVSYMANTQENLRAGMHFMVRDLMQAGEGIPQGGISLPYSWRCFGGQSPRHGPSRNFPTPTPRCRRSLPVPSRATSNLSESRHWCDPHRCSEPTSSISSTRTTFFRIRRGTTFTVIPSFRPLPQLRFAPERSTLPARRSRSRRPVYDARGDQSNYDRQFNDVPQPKRNRAGVCDQRRWTDHQFRRRRSRRVESDRKDIWHGREPGHHVLACFRPPRSPGCGW